MNIFSGKSFFFDLTRGPRSEVKTGLELKCNLSFEHVDKSLFLFTIVAPPF